MSAWGHCLEKIVQLAMEMTVPNPQPQSLVCPPQPREVRRGLLRQRSQASPMAMPSQVRNNLSMKMRCVQGQETVCLHGPALIVSVASLEQMDLDVAPMMGPLVGADVAATFEDVLACTTDLNQCSMVRIPTTLCCSTSCASFFGLPS